MLNSQTKILLLIFAGIVLVYLLFAANSNNNQTETFTIVDNMEANYETIPENMDINFSDGADANTNPSIDSRSVFECKPGKYKSSSFNGSKRGFTNADTWDNYFDNNNTILISGKTNGDFVPNTEFNDGASIEFAPFQSSGNVANSSPEDLFNLDNHLPQETNKDWFQTIDEPVSVKNRHLINTARPIATNTVGRTKNGGYDIRMAPPNPKVIVSPWNNTSLEPDTNIKALM